jgi:hypothetical protein
VLPLAVLWHAHTSSPHSCADVKARTPVRTGVGGFRGTHVRKSLFPGKDQKVTVLLTAVAKDTLTQTTARPQKPRIASADTVAQLTISEAAEYLIRRGAGMALED